MNRRGRPVWLLVISFLLLVGLIVFINIFSPDSQLTILNYKFSVLPVFFLLSFAFLLSLVTYFFRSFRRAALIGFLTIIYLIFRMLHLNSPVFLLLLVALYITLELFFKKHI